jgi:hypothetical protein
MFRGTIYFIQPEAGGPVKIGFTADLERRLVALRTGSPVPLKVIGTCMGTVADEKRLHLHFDAERVDREWFAPSPELLAAIASGDPLAVCRPAAEAITARPPAATKRFEMALDRATYEAARARANACGLGLVPWLRMLAMREIEAQRAVQEEGGDHG